MAWKPKEKPLTQEEAVALARKDLAACWHGSAPLLAGVRAPQGATVHPLDPAFSEGSWLLLFADPTGLGAASMREVAAEWHLRYQSHRLGVILILRWPYARLGVPEQTAQWLERNPCPFIVVHDAEGLLSEAFQAARQPKVVLLQKGRRILEQQGDAWLAGVESRIQSFLRETDPGLPLPPPLELPERAVRSPGSIEFTDPAIFPKPFVPGPNGVPVARFDGTVREGVAIYGTWARDGARIVTADRTARIEVEMSAAHLGLVAQCASNEPGYALVTIELDGGAVYEEGAGADLTVSDTGDSAVKVREGRLYLLLALPEGRHRVTLRFPAAQEMPVALYAIRFGR